MQLHLPATLPSFANASLMVLGDIMLDRYWFGSASRISPEAPVPIVNINEIDHRPGGAANVAFNLTALGCKTILVGITGNDEAAQILTEQLQAASVNPQFIYSKQIETIIKLRVISQHQQLLRLDFEKKLLHGEEEQLLSRFKHSLNKVKLVILSDYNEGTLTDPQAFIKLAQEAKVPVIVDPRRDDYVVYSHAYLITPNFKEFEAIVGHCENETEITQKGQALLARYNIANLLVTRGERGMTLIRPNHPPMHLPAYAKEVYDVTGAGDTVIAALGAAIAAGADLETAVSLSNLAASLVVNRLGAASVSMPELNLALSSHATFSAGIVNEEQLLQVVQEAKALGKKIIFTNGCFDVFHAGHATYLQLAKKLGDILIVAVNDDQSIRQLKGPSRPINILENRMTVLASLGVVDWVIGFSDETPERLLKAIRPDILVKGGNYAIDQVIGADIVKAYGGEVKVINHPFITESSTAIIQQMNDEKQNEVINGG